MGIHKKICLIGAGKGGLNHIKTLFELKSLSAVVDKNQHTLNRINKQYPDCEFYCQLNDDIIEKFDGFIVATNPSSHFDIAKQIILGGKPVLVEKPLTLDYKSSKILCQLSKKMRVNLMVGHILLFHPAFQKMKKIINEGRIGDIQYIYSNRLNMGNFRTNENVFWSFAPHDISLFNYFFEEKPKKIHSNGIDILQDGIHDTSVTTFDYNGKRMGHIFVSWLHPFKEHRFVIIGSEGMLHFEDSSNGKPLLYYDNRAEFKNLVPKPLKGEIKQIHYSHQKPLFNELKYFISNLNSKKVGISSGEDGLEVVKILEQASMKLTF
jgi:predicted dehydrogenase